MELPFIARFIYCIYNFCSHCSKKKLMSTKLKQDERYHWLIENIDTTVLKNDYTYDRFLLKFL